MNEQEYQQRLADERLLGQVVVKHIVNTQLAIPLGVFIDQQDNLRPWSQPDPIYRDLRNTRRLLSWNNGKGRN